MITNETIEKGKIKKEPYTGIKPKIHTSISESQSKMFDEKTSEAICVIDLDTVMPGSLLYDFGDALRIGAARPFCSPMLFTIVLSASILI